MQKIALVFFFIICCILGYAQKPVTKMDLRGIATDADRAILWISDNFKDVVPSDTITKLKSGHPFMFDEINKELPKEKCSQYTLFGNTVDWAFAQVSDDRNFKLYFVCELPVGGLSILYNELGKPAQEVGERNDDGNAEFIEWVFSRGVYMVVYENLMANQMHLSSSNTLSKKYSIVFSNLSTF